MAVRSKRLFHGQMSATSGAWTTVYTVPSQETALLKSIQFVNTDSTGAQRMDLGINGTNAAQRLYMVSVPAQGTVSVEAFIVMHPGDTLRARAVGSATASCALCVSGAELEGVAD